MGDGGASFFNSYDSSGVAASALPTAARPGTVDTDPESSKTRATTLEAFLYFLPFFGFGELAFRVPDTYDGAIHRRRFVGCLRHIWREF